ncbi:MAG: DUF1674 domain-containing protein [Pseudomonadota bacterium]
MSDKQSPAPVVYPASRETASTDTPATSTDATSASSQRAQPSSPREIGGREGPEPTRFGDWEKNGRCIDF